MALLADIFLLAAALGATFYCVVLSRRLNKFTDLEEGVGGAISALSSQVEDMTRTLKMAQGAASASASSLGAMTGRAEDAARRLELLVAAMHDLPPIPAASEDKLHSSPSAVRGGSDQPAEARTIQPAREVSKDEPYEPIPAFSTRRASREAAE